MTLLGAVRSCQVNTGYANRIQSDRFLNPQLMTCPTWQGVDNAGRPVSEYSFVTKSAGCNLPNDRITIENGLRPSYFEYVNLDAAGLKGNMDMTMFDSAQRVNDYNQHFSGQTPSFGQQLQSNVYTSCQNYPYNTAVQQEATNMRMNSALQEGFRANQMRRAAGF